MLGFDAERGRLVDDHIFQVIRVCDAVRHAEQMLTNTAKQRILSSTVEAALVVSIASRRLLSGSRTRKRRSAVLTSVPSLITAGILKFAPSQVNEILPVGSAIGLSDEMLRRKGHREG